MHQQLAARRGVAKGNKAAAQLHLARIRAVWGEVKIFRPKTISRPSSISVRSGLWPLYSEM